MDSVIRFAEINKAKSFEFNLTLSREKVSDLITRLDLINLKKVSLLGKLSPSRSKEWRLKAELRATVKQKCVITFKPVQTIVNETIIRTFSALAFPNVLTENSDDGISPVKFDDSLQELKDEIDLAEIIFEELILILPLYPKFADAELGRYTVTEPGVEPLNNENLKPFAQLSELKEKIFENKKNTKLEN
tara:strand:+ start:1383 stop:1952 length:570 start_codon:yes stop_codon:yes gene_type:complete